MDIKVGLEIHGYLRTEQKLFCTCEIDRTAEPNTTICPVCTSQPGARPMLPNKEAVDTIIAIALMLGCRLNKTLMFQRKHYSWPDLPSGYQRTMSGSYSLPVGTDGEFLGIGIEEVHLEEDPAAWDPNTGLVDYNRSGYPLVEIVTKPDFSSPDQLREWLKRLITTLSYVKALDKDAGIKSDVNVSIAPDFRRVEIKNVNSFRSIVRAVEYEAHRQKSEKVKKQHTRAWDDKVGATVFMRDKETAEDYMFIPEPDLPVIHVDDRWRKTIESSLPEPPSAKRKRYLKLGLDEIHAESISSDLALADIFETAAEEVDPVLAAKWVKREVVRVANYNKIDSEDLNLDRAQFTKLLSMVEAKRITEKVAKEFLERLVKKSFDVEKEVKKLGLESVRDAAQIERWCEESIRENPKVVDDVKSGKENAVNFLVGRVMRKSRGTASPEEVKKIIKEIIS